MRLWTLLTVVMCFAEVIGRERRLGNLNQDQHKTITRRAKLEAFFNYERSKKALKNGFELSKSSEHHLSSKNALRKQYSRSSTGDTESPNNEACEGGRRITCSQGVVMSPGYPDGYPSSSNCTWNIVADEGKVVSLTFADFALADSTTDCLSGDRVTLSDPANAISELPPVALCGGTEVPKYITEGNEARVTFVSDGNGEDKGFIFNFKVHDPVECEDTVQLVGESGELTSQAYPINYQPNSHCYWRIVAPSGTVVTLSFDDIDIESARSCEYDAVHIYDGPTNSDPSLGSLCGTENSRVVTANTNVVLVELVADGSNEGRGFSLTWSAQ